jgi:hypothetical protein
MLGRRKFLGNVGATAAVLTAAKTLAGGANAQTGPGARNALAAAELRPNARFGTCEVVSVETTEDGAVRVRLADSAGEPFEIELLGYDPHAPGVARAGSLSVYMNNRGRGTAATIEEHGLAAMAIAQNLARAEAAGAKLPVLPRLLERAAVTSARA